MARRTGLASLTFGQLQAELRRRARRAGALERRRDSLVRKLQALDAQIHQIGGASGRARLSGRRRASNKQTLAGALHELLRGKTMSVTDAAQAVQDAGYKTNSRTFRVQVNIALVKRKDLFRRVARGRYTSK
jgi:hypothetical protein